MIINMTTFAGRQKHYIHRTLESLSRSDGRHVPVNLILGSNDTSHVEQYRGSVNIVPWDREAQSLAREGKLRHNCNVNALRALRYGDDDHCLCCEDDIVFDECWLDQLSRTIEQIDRKDYVLNLGHGSREQEPGKRYAVHSQPFLCGGQGIFYPSKALRSSVADYLQQNIYKGLNDALIGRYAKQYAALYNTVPRLIGHIGGTSSFTQPVTRDTSASHGSESNTGKVSSGAAAATQRAADPVRVDSRPHLRPRGSSSPATSEALLALLRASLGTGDFPGDGRLADCDWETLERLASHHGLAGILYQSIRGREQGVPEKQLRHFKAHYVANAYRSHVAQTCVEEVGAALGKERITGIVMKGAALLRTLYEDPGLRVIGDVDLLVEEKDVERAAALLQCMGMQRFASDHAEQQRGPLCHIHRVYCRPEPRAIPIELHWRLFEPYLPYVFDLEAVWARAQPLSGVPASVCVMAPEHELAHLCVHLDRHAITFRSLVRRHDWRELLLIPQGLARLVWLYDIALYLRRRSADIDWDDFIDQARRWAMDDRLYATLELSRRALGVGPPAEVLQALRRGKPRFVERMAHQVLLASYRARELEGSSSSMQSRWLPRMSGHVLRAANTWISLFPPDAYLRAKYDARRAPLWLRRRHLQEVVPGLWGEARDRLRALGGS